MTFKTAKKIENAFVLDQNFEIVLRDSKQKLEDPMCKGYVYANLYFYDEVEKEIDKLRSMIKKIHDEITVDIGGDPNDVQKLLMELCTRVRNQIGEDSLDVLVKEMLAERCKHMCLMTDAREHEKLEKICSAIFMELVAAFFDMTIHNARDLDGGVKTFRFSKQYVEKLTPRQKKLLAPALRMVGFENQVKLNDFELAQDWTVKYKPERLPTAFARQEDTIKDQIKTFIQKHS